MTLPIEPRIIHSLFVVVVDHIKDGKVFHDGDTSSQIIQDFDVLFKAFEEGRRTVLQILLPDEQGYLPTDETCAEIYRSQLDETQYGVVE